MNQIDEQSNKNTDNNEVERVEVTSKWFSIKLEEINGYTLAAIAMILITLVTVVWIVSQ